ncbi:hypothetical protein [Dyella tabacisoli]|uniref:Uncharacterized protein n=1 Tax=Dyella tabacisoli TaxID=2282381 RepID=A0A369UPR0_9GAMM|nr:hypothetical protein [Dyella tabacisoli]RDD82734.1 hypothetical protein DVJ77_04230 [Dyella tabacisoli]
MMTIPKSLKHLQHIARAVGTTAALEATAVFFGYSLLLSLLTSWYGVDFCSKLPNDLYGLINAPLSLSLFGLLTLVGLLNLALFTGLGTRDLLGSATPVSKFARYLSLPICRAAFSVGMTVVGALAGIGIGLHLVGDSYCHLNDIGRRFTLLAFVTFSMVIPAWLLALLLLDVANRAHYWLGLLVILYLISLIAFVANTGIDHAEAAQRGYEAVGYLLGAAGCAAFIIVRRISALSTSD